SYEYVSKMAAVGIELDDMPIERWKVLAVMPLGYALVGLRFLQILYKLITGEIDSLSLADEAADAMHLKADDSAFDTTGARS
ncbi:MAG: C4-dicarboxylate transporter DctQ subunit, partial [Burkholderiaceae bacterium]